MRRHVLEERALLDAAAALFNLRPQAFHLVIEAANLAVRVLDHPVEFLDEVLQECHPDLQVLDPGLFRLCRLAHPTSRPSAAARVRVNILENLDAEMRAVLSTEARHFRQCYARALDRNPELAGSMTVDINLEAGRPERGSAIQVDDTGDWRLVACVEDAVKDWAVPGDRAEKVAFVLEFSSRRS